ncbi:hypothetical protein [Frateuria aurantia]|uniref:hypothetical protein n=1 Tax=Frateuria aurantia TaxID=81475 RepID=UPI0012EABAEE|nr:hypothetical protein [Frateuria aurantia]
MQTLLQNFTGTWLWVPTGLPLALQREDGQAAITGATRPNDARSRLKGTDK